MFTHDLAKKFLSYAKGKSSMKNSMTWRIFVNRLKYLKRKVYHMIGFCPACGNYVNYLPDGHAVCPQCGAR